MSGCLLDGNEAQFSDGHDQRITKRGADVPQERDLGDPRHLSESIPESGFRSRSDAGDVAHPRFSSCQIECGQSKPRLDLNQQ